MFILRTQEYDELRLRFSHTGRFLVVSDEVWSLPDCLRIQPEIAGTFVHCEWNPVADELYAPRECDLQIITPHGELVQKLPDANARWIQGMAFTPAGDWLFMFNPFLLTGWKRVRGKWRSQWSVDVKKTRGLKNDSFESVAAFPDGRRTLALILRRDGKDPSNPWRSLFVQRDMKTGEVLGEQPINWKDSPHGTLTRLSITPDGAQVIGFRGRSVLAWALGSDEPPRRTPVSKKDVRDVALHPSGRWVLVANGSSEVSIWDTTTWKAIRTLDWKIGPVECADISADGLLAAVTGETGKAVVWDWDL